MTTTTTPTTCACGSTAVIVTQIPAEPKCAPNYERHCKACGAAA